VVADGNCRELQVMIVLNAHVNVLGMRHEIHDFVGNEVGEYNATTNNDQQPQEPVMTTTNNDSSHRNLS